MDNLAQFQIFSGISHDVLAEISLFTKTKVYEAGEVIISENDTGQYNLFLLVSGEVEVTSNKTKLTSKEVVLSREKKELLGEVSWLLNVKRTATVRAIRNAEVMEIDGKSLKNYLDHHCNVGYSIMTRVAKMIASRLQESDVLLKQVLWNSNI